MESVLHFKTPCVSLYVFMLRAEVLLHLFCFKAPQPPFSFKPPEEISNASSQCSKQQLCAEPELSCAQRLTLK